MKKVILLSVISLLLFSSCEKEDFRDVYVGNWGYNRVGSISLYKGSSIIGTAPANDSGTTLISKTGTNELDFDGFTGILSGSKLLFDVTTETQSSSGTIMQISIARTGTASVNLISVKETYSGTWSNNSGSGILSGTSNITMNKK